MTIALELENLGVAGAQLPLAHLTVPRRPRRLVKKVILGFVVTVLAVVAAIGIYIGITLYKIDHAVHHVVLSPALLAKGQSDLLAVVQGPHGHEEIYVFRTTGGHSNVLSVPSTLSVTGPKGLAVPLSTLDVHQPTAIIHDLRHLGIPVGRYVGVDLHAADPSSLLGKLALGKMDVTSLLTNPTGTSSLLEAAASHVYLGPNTPVSSLLSLMHVQSSTTLSMPTSTGPHGTVVLASAATDVLRRFL